MRDRLTMLNAQCSMFNKCKKNQFHNSLGHLNIDNSLKIDNCELLITSKGGSGARI